MPERSNRIQDLSPKQRNSGFQRLEKREIGSERWLRMAGASDAELRALEIAWPGPFDARRVGLILNLKKMPKRPAPKPAHPDERIVYLPASIKKFEDLRFGGYELFFAPIKDAIEEKVSHCMAKPGYWGVIAPVAGSNLVDSDDGELFELKPGSWKGYMRTPLLVDALLMSVSFAATRQTSPSIRCKEEGAKWNHLVVLSVDRGGLYVGETNKADLDDHYTFTSAARWICD